MLNTNTKLGLFIFLFLSASVVAHAKIYKWQDARGNVQYSDNAPLISANKPTQKLILTVLESQASCSVKPFAKNSSPVKLFELNFFDVPGYSLLGRPAPSLSLGSSAGANSGYFKPAFGFSSWVIGGWAKPVKATLPSTVSRPASALTVPAKNVVAVNAPVLVGAVTLPVSQPPVSAGVATVTNFFPAINPILTPLPKIGASTAMLENMQNPGLSPEGGVFRSICDFSHMSNDDPIIFPGLPNATHHHTFFGNTSIRSDSNLMNLVNTGNSTCAGGTLNRTGYWVPTMVDTKLGKALRPVDVVLYYKVGGVVPRQYITAPPLGLRMIAGNSRATTPSADNAPDNSSFRCFTNQHPTIISTRDIPACLGTGTLRADIKFPQCWDGKNLDSPDHKSHMAYENLSYSTANKCPESHPVAIPKITILADYIVSSSKETSTWRLASDNYPVDKPSGYSYHGDWVNGWDVKTMDKIVNNCLKKGLECNDHLGDGTGLSKTAAYTN